MNTAIDLLIGVLLGGAAGSLGALIIYWIGRSRKVKRRQLAHKRVTQRITGLASQALAAIDKARDLTATLDDATFDKSVADAKALWDTRGPGGDR